MGFTEVKIEKTIFDSIPESNRGKALSLRDTYGSRYMSTMVQDAKVHDANFAFFSAQLLK